MAFIECKGICKSYDGKHQVLTKVDLQIQEGELVTLLGPSGCGKSTLLRAIAGLEDIDKGCIMLDGKDITNTPVQKRGIGMVFQQYSLFMNMTVEENIAFGLKISKYGKQEIKEKVQRAIEMVDLKGKEHHYPNELSGGQQQRVAIARAIVMEPKVLLLDEPLSAIDAKLRKSLQEEIKKVQQQLKITTIFVTHDQDEAMLMSDTIHVLNKGVIEQSGKPVELYTHPVSKFVAEFIGHYNVVNHEDLKVLLPSQSFHEGYYAIRPETLLLQETPIQQDHMYCMKATVKKMVTRGNVLRYTLCVDDVCIKSEVLFRSFALFEEGKTVYVGVEPHNIISIKE